MNHNAKCPTPVRLLVGAMAALLIGLCPVACNRGSGGALSGDTVESAVAMPSDSLPEAFETGESGTSSSPSMTLPAIEDVTAPTEPMLPPVEPDPAGCYDALVISAYYAAGSIAGASMAEASYVELTNTSDSALELHGVSLYLSNRGEAFAEYRFAEGDVIPAGGQFLVRGRSAVGAHAGVLSLTHSDRTFATLAPDTEDVRLCLAPAGQSLPTDKPLSLVEGVYAYVTSHAADAADAIHYVSNLSANKVVIKKADTDMVDYKTVNLTKSSTEVLEQIRPRTTKGDVNTTVKALVPEVVFSHPSGVYKEGFDLTLTAPEGYRIYITINGTDPRNTMPLSYLTPLHLTDTASMTWGNLTTLASTLMGSTYDPLAATFPGAIVIKAFAVSDLDGTTTQLSTRTYFIGEVFAEWGVDLVSLTLSEERFLGSKGVYNNIRQGMGSVREHIPAHVEFFSPEGECVHAGWCEIAMNGKGSLGMTQKSFRVLLKSNVMECEAVGENLNTLNYDLFGEYASETPTGERVTWYRHILLRNGGGDMSGSTISRSHIGDAYIQRLDRFLTPDVMAYAPVMVFVNGEFWGMYNARDRMDSTYFEGKYGIPEEDFVMLECPYPLFYGWDVDYTEGGENDPEEAAYFMELVRYCQQNDMSDPVHYQYIADRIDLDGLIDFYCAQIYLCCSDWPSNNIKIWRNKNPDNPYVDTKWHFCIVDTDHGVGLNSTVDTDLFGVINDGPVLSRIVNHLLRNPTFRKQFNMRYVWCIEVYFAPERMIEELDTLVGSITPVMQYQLDRWRCTNGEQTDWDKWYSYIEVIRDFANRRPERARQQFMSWAGMTPLGYQQYLEQAIARWGDSVPD